MNERYKAISWLMPTKRKIIQLLSKSTFNLVYSGRFTNIRCQAVSTNKHLEYNILRSPIHSYVQLTLFMYSKDLF
jgi:hypothetical protein